MYPNHLRIKDSMHVIQPSIHRCGTVSNLAEILNMNWIQNTKSDLPHPVLQSVRATENENTFVIPKGYPWFARTFYPNGDRSHEYVRQRFLQLGETPLQAIVPFLESGHTVSCFVDKQFRLNVGIEKDLASSDSHLVLYRDHHDTLIEALSKCISIANGTWKLFRTYSSDQSQKTGNETICDNILYETRADFGLHRDRWALHFKREGDVNYVIAEDQARQHLFKAEIVLFP